MGAIRRGYKRYFLEYESDKVICGSNKHYDYRAASIKTLKSAIKKVRKEEAEYNPRNFVIYDSDGELARKVYTDGYYHTAYEIQKGIGVGFDLMQLDTNRIDKLIAKPWAADGKNFSQRIWNNRAQLVAELENRLTQSIIRGQSPKKVIAEIAERFNVNKSRAGALVMTESAFFAAASQRDAFNDLDVEKYEVLATLDSRTSETCRRMDGQVIPMSEYKPGVTAPPFHVRCRSTTVPYFDDEFSVLDKRAARDEDGKYYTVPASMKYKDWEEAFVKGGSKDGLRELPRSGKIVVRNRLVAGKHPVTDEQITDILGNELQNVKMSATPKYNSRIRTAGRTTVVKSPMGFVKSIEISIGKQTKGTKLELIDTLLHEELEARVLIGKTPLKQKQAHWSEDKYHKYIDKVIKRFFRLKGW
ncbi:MAG: minor capsid protein [Phascolarctobacterium sp.]|nr:minor capsid protein [Phascolarctobacterium sp.]